MIKPNPALDAALKLQAAGFALLPLKGKAPDAQLLPRDPETGKPSTDILAKDPATARDIQAWFAARRAPNIGVFSGTGGCPVLGVDLDPAKALDSGRKSILESRGGPTRELMPGVALPPTPLQVMTGSGGRHLYYAHPPPQVRCVTRVGHPAGANVDIQAEHRYLVLPPSIHDKTGQPYIWVDDDDRVLSLDRVVEILAEGLPPAPAWCIREESDGRAPPEAPRVQSGDWIAHAWTFPIPEGGRLDGTGGRKQTLRSLAQYCAKNETPLDIALAQLAQWNKSICRPPLDDSEVARITSWIYERVHEERASEVSDRINLRTRGPRWPHDLLLGTKFGRWVDAVSKSRGVHPDLTAVCGLGALGCASTGGYKLHYLEPGITLEDRHWTAPTALWLMPIMESGGRKSVVFREIMPALESYGETLAIVCQRYNAELEDLAEQLHGAKKAAMAATRGDDRETALEARRELTQRIAALPAPMGDRWLISDATPEKFLDALSKVGHLALVSEEGAETISKFFGHYSGASDQNGLLKAWDGGRTVQDRIGRGTIIAQGLASMLTMVQPSVLRGLNGTDAEERGLMARFLFAAPPPLDIEKEEIPKARVAQAHAEFDRALNAIYYGGTTAADQAVKRAEDYRPEYVPDESARPIELPAEGDTPQRGRPKNLGKSSAPPAEKLVRPELRAPVDVLIQGECVERLQALETGLKAKAREGGEHYTARGWIRKAHEHAMRIAVVLQLCEEPPTDHETQVMDPKWIQLAISIVRDYFIPNYYVAKDLIDSPPLADLGLHILTHFRDRDSFTLGEAANLVHKRTPDIRPILLWLEQVGAVKTESRGKSLIVYPLPNVVF